MGWRSASMPRTAHRKVWGRALGLPEPLSDKFRGDWKTTFSLRNRKYACEEGPALRGDGEWSRE
jgi:hypothetical protein